MAREHATGGQRPPVGELMFLYAYVDLLSFYEPGVVDDILAGIVWQFDITQT